MEMEKKKETNKIIYYLIVFFIGCLAMYTVVYVFQKNPEITETITKLEKDVTVTDQGIADAVEKIYDATVIVKIETTKGKTGWGSGFVYKVVGNDAYILTNHHVIDSAKKITVVYNDESEVEATLVSSDKYVDVAVIKVPKDTIKAIAEIGSSADLRVGDTVFAVGTPISLDYVFTVTRGILSGKDRLTVMTEEEEYSSGYSYFFGTQTQIVDMWYQNLLQTDTAINSGNSGGPLCNSNGEVVGLTNSKLANSAIDNMSFAVPIEDAINVAEQLINNGELQRPYIGIAMTDLSQTQAISASKYADTVKNSNLTSGVLINSVEKGLAADKAGIKEGDIIVKVNDTDVKNMLYFKYYLYNKCKVGETVKLTIYRDGKMQDFNVTLGSNKQTV